MKPPNLPPSPDQRRARAEQLLDEPPTVVGVIGQRAPTEDEWHRQRVERYLESIAQGMAALNTAAADLVAALRDVAPLIRALSVLPPVVGPDGTTPPASPDGARAAVNPRVDTSVTPETVQGVLAGSGATPQVDGES